MLHASDARHEKSDFPIGKSLNFNAVPLALGAFNDLRQMLSRFELEDEPKNDCPLH